MAGILDGFCRASGGVWCSEFFVWRMLLSVGSMAVLSWVVEGCFFVYFGRRLSRSWAYGVMDRKNREEGVHMLVWLLGSF